MGIARVSARLLLAEAGKRPFSGRVLQLGRQHLYFTDRDLERWAPTHGVQLTSEYLQNNKREALLNPWYNDSAYMDDGSFFARIGFERVESCDYSGDEEPTYLIDLNDPVPDSLIGKFDVVYDGGTLEHVFNIPNALKNVHLLLKDGGRIIHHSPSSNHVDHGFYMFSPCLFVDYYATNSYKICEAQLVEYDKNWESQPCFVYNYVPGCIDDDLSFGGFDRGKLLLISLVAAKMENSTCGITPQQGRYARTWQDRNLWNSSKESYERSYGSPLPNYEQPKMPASSASRIIEGLKKRLGLSSVRQPTRPLDLYKVAEW